MVRFMRGIVSLVSKVVSEYCGEEVSEKHKEQGVFYPLIHQARQMEIFRIFCDIECMLVKLKEKRFFQECKRIYVLNNFLKTLKPSLLFLEKFLLDNPHFHVVLPPPAKKNNKRYFRKH